MTRKQYGYSPLCTVLVYYGDVTGAWGQHHLLAIDAGGQLTSRLCRVYQCIKHDNLDPNPQLRWFHLRRRTRAALCLVIRICWRSQYIDSRHLVGLSQSQPISEWMWKRRGHPVPPYSDGWQRDGARQIQLKRAARLASRRHALIMTRHRTALRFNRMRVARNPQASGHALLGLVTVWVQLTDSDRKLADDLRHSKHWSVGYNILLRNSTKICYGVPTHVNIFTVQLSTIMPHKNSY